MLDRNRHSWPETTAVRGFCCHTQALTGTSNHVLARPAQPNPVAIWEHDPGL